MPDNIGRFSNNPGQTMSDNYNHRAVPTNGIRLHVVEAGPPDGPLVILLHGFPEFWYGWHKQIDALASAGYRVLVPDQRGYNLSDKPKGRAAYCLDELAADVLGLIDEAGCDKAVLIGHDWGAAVTWWTANKFPDRLQRIAILNVPHHRVMRKHLTASWAQLKKSWYVFFFQIPWIPERRMAADNWRNGARALRGSCRKGTFPDEDIARYREAWSQPGAATGMINWYRAALRNPPKKLPSPRITVPTLMIWGKQDKFLGHEMAQPSIDLCDDGRLVFFDDATHWVQHEEHEAVNKLLLEFLGEKETTVVG